MRSYYRILLLSPFAVFDTDGNYALRGAIGIQGNAVAFAGNVSEGATVKYTKVTKDDLLHSVEEWSKKKAVNLGADKDRLNLMISCCVRNQYLGTEVNKEFQIIDKNLPGKTFRVLLRR